MSQCDICGEKLALSKEGYKNHIKRFHSVVQTPVLLPEIRKIVPLRVTSRSVAQIIHDMEKMWGAAIFPRVQPWHALGECAR